MHARGAYLNGIIATRCGIWPVCTSHMTSVSVPMDATVPDKDRARGFLDPGIVWRANT